MIRIAIIGICAVLIAIQFKNGKTEYGIYISLAACIIIFGLGLNYLETIINTINQIQGYIQVNQSYIAILIKIIGITYIAEFSSNLCKDAGHAAISNQIELVGKLTILSISMPILMALLQTMNEFLT